MVQVRGKIITKTTTTTSSEYLYVSRSDVSRERRERQTESIDEKLKQVSGFPATKTCAARSRGPWGPLGENGGGGGVV